MATNRKLRAELLSQLGVTPQRLSQRVKVIKEKHGPMSTEDATYVIAHQSNIDLTKYLDTNQVDRIRALLPAPNSTTTPSLKKPGKTKRKSAVILRIAPNLGNLETYLSSSLAKDAKVMAEEVYPKYYVLENSIRLVIMKILESQYGSDWWTHHVAKHVRDNVIDRMKREAKRPWHGKRGQHEIFYSNFGDLKQIITKNWSHFQDIFDTQAWITQRLEELEHPRNVMAHHNPVSDTDKKRIDLYFSEWMAILKDKSHLLPE